ncbi:MAG: pantetheine-phosphate adenylyltransferase [Prevotella sp.]|jgi:pantetheine-phosphate adenylyltransferase
MKTGLFTGTFDPFTIGHKNIVDRAVKLFDKLIIAVAESELKHTSRDIDERMKAIQRLYANDSRVKVVAYNDLTIDLAHRENVDFIVRGVRSVKDYEYEIVLADFNRHFGGVETIFFPADPNLEMVSSTMVRELEHFGKDVSKFIPQPEKDDETAHF